MLTDPALFVQWMADDATLDPRPGGVVRWTHANGDTCSGEYVELVPARRVVFTYGWERADVEIPPGSTTVEIDLTATTDTTHDCCGSSTAGSTISPPAPTTADGRTTSTASAVGPKADPRA